MTLVRIGGQLVDDERACINCTASAPAEPHQHKLPEKVAELRTQSRAYADLAKRKAAEADALQAEIEATKIPAWLCANCWRHLHDPNLRMAWGGGRHDADATALIARTLDYLQDPNHLPGRGGACAVCRAGSKHREEVLT